MIPWLIVALSLGLAAAFIAHSKGQNFALWFVYGLVLGVVAVPHALFMRGNEAGAPTPGRRRKQPDSFDPATIDAAAFARRRDESDDLRGRDVQAVWSDDAFERIAGGKLRRGEAMAQTATQTAAQTGQDVAQDVPSATVPRYAAAAARREPELRLRVPQPPGAMAATAAPLNEQAKRPRRDGPQRDYLYPVGGTTPDPVLRLGPADAPAVSPAPAGVSARATEPPAAAPEPLEAPVEVSAPELVAPEPASAEAPRSQIAAASTAEATSVPRLDRHEAPMPAVGERFEPRFSGATAAAAAVPAAANDELHEDEETARIARRFSPDPADATAPRHRLRRARAERNAMWGYVAAAACLVVAVVVLWPQLSNLASSPQLGSWRESLGSAGPRVADVAPAPGAPAAGIDGSPPSATADGGTAAEPADATGTAGTPEETPPALAASGPAPNLPPPDVPQAAQRDRDPGAVEAPDFDLPASGPVFVQSRGVTPPDMAAAAPARDPASPAPPDIGPPRRKPAVPPSVSPQKAAASETGARTASRAAPRAAPDTEPEVISAAGQMVVLLQAALRERGYDPGPVNGRAGRKTREAIVAFKQKEGLGSDANIDSRLLERLGIVGKRLHPFAATTQ